MNIEFHVPAGIVKEWLIEHVRQRLVEMHHLDPNMSRVAVYFRLQETAGDGKVCELDIPEFGTSLFIHKAAPSFEQAIREVLDELQSRLERKAAIKNEPPDIITSSVDVG